MSSFVNCDEGEAGTLISMVKQIRLFMLILKLFACFCFDGILLNCYANFFSFRLDIILLAISRQNVVSFVFIIA